MNKIVHPNIKLLITRMENAFQEDDFSLVLKTSADIFETLAKDIIDTPAIQNQTLASFFEIFRKNSILPQEILDYIYAVYKNRNMTPLAGHGSTQSPNISRDTAFVLCELTKTLVNIEYRLQNSNVSFFNETENMQEKTIQFNLSLTDKGFEKDPNNDLKASFVEAIYEAKKGAQLSFEVSYLPLELMEEIINSPQFNNSNPDSRIGKIKLKEIADHSRELKLIMEKALNLISIKSIINQVSDARELIDVINGISQKLSIYSPNSQRNMLIETFYDAQGEFSRSQEEKDLTGIAIFHKILKLSTSFRINQNQLVSLLKQMNLSSNSQLIGEGWDMYDLTDEIRFQKAIPAILIEMVYSKLIDESNIDLDEVLHPSYWRIGLA